MVVSAVFAPANLFAQSQTTQEAEEQPRSILFPSGIPAPYFPNEEEISGLVDERLDPLSGPSQNIESTSDGDQDLVELEKFIELDRSAFGTLLPNEGGLAKNIWQPSSFEEIERLLNVLKLPTTSPAMDVISRKLLLSFASAPTGQALVVLADEENDDQYQPINNQFDEELLKSFINLRLKELVERGNITDLVVFLQNLPEGTLEPEQANAEILMLGGDLIGACQMTQRARVQSDEIKRTVSRFSIKPPGVEDKTDDVFWLKMLSFCRVLEDNTAEAQVALDLLSEKENADYVFIELLNTLMETPEDRGFFRSRGLTSLDPLNYTILTLLDQSIDADLIETSPPLIVSALVTNPNLTAETRFRAAVKSYLVGGVSAEIMSNIYDLQDFTEMELNNAVRLTEFDDRPLADALLYQAASKQPVDQNKADILDAIWQRATENNDIGRKAVLNKGTLTSIALTLSLRGKAHSIARGLLLAGDIDQAKRWYDFSKQGAAGGDAEATHTFINIWPLIMIASDNGDNLWSEDELNLWWESQTEFSPESRDRKATLFYAIAEAFGHQVPQDNWASLIGGNHDQDMKSIPLEVWRELIRAVEERKPAESILLGLIAMGADGPGSLDGTGISTVIRMLRMFDLEQEARNIAIEALVANGF